MGPFRIEFTEAEARLLMSGLHRLRKRADLAHRNNKARNWLPPPGKQDSTLLLLSNVDQLMEKLRQAGVQWDLPEQYQLRRKSL
jgi:hypothetical protein